MPFGSDPFREKVCLGERSRGKTCWHQCLSAVIPFGTMQFNAEGIFFVFRHQCLSAVIPFGTLIIETKR